MYGSSFIWIRKCFICFYQIISGMNYICVCSWILRKLPILEKIIYRSTMWKALHLWEDKYVDWVHIYHVIFYYKHYMWMVVRICRARSDFLVNDLLQTLQINGSSFVWVNICWLIVLFWENDMSQTLHTNGFSFVWIRVCRVRFGFSENDMLQTLHVNGFVWERICRFRSDFLLMTCYKHYKWMVSRLCE